VKREKVRRKVMSIIAKELCIGPERLTEDHCLVEDLGIDSLRIASLTTELEDEFGIDSLTEAEGIVTIGDIVEFIAIELQLPATTRV